MGRRVGRALRRQVRALLGGCLRALGVLPGHYGSCTLDIGLDDRGNIFDLDAADPINGAAALVLAQAHAQIRTHAVIHRGNHVIDSWGVATGHRDGQRVPPDAESLAGKKRVLLAVV